MTKLEKQKSNKKINAAEKAKLIEKKRQQIALTNRAFQWTSVELRNFMFKHGLTDDRLAAIVNKSPRAVKYWKAGGQTIDPLAAFYLAHWASIRRVCS
jgi:hypothetical protein